MHVPKALVVVRKFNVLWGHGFIYKLQNTGAPLPFYRDFKFSIAEN
jgi:hypothetical protein